MTTIDAKVPDCFATLAAEAAARAQTTLDQVIARALSAQRSAWKVLEDMPTRAKRGRAEEFRHILAHVPHAPPLPGDER